MNKMNENLTHSTQKSAIQAPIGDLRVKMSDHELQCPRYVSGRGLLLRVVPHHTLLSCHLSTVNYQ